MKYVQMPFWKEHLCALQVFLCALASRFVCERTSAQLRGNIGFFWSVCSSFAIMTKHRGLVNCRY